MDKSYILLGKEGVVHKRGASIYLKHDSATQVQLFKDYKSYQPARGKA
jgi:hypothetical protein